jgi:hypothetical protein
MCSILEGARVISLAMLRWLPKFGILAFCSLAHATPETGSQWLSEMDRAGSPFSDAQLRLEVSVEKGNGKTVQRSLEVWQRGQKERKVRMTAPARLAGVTLLVVEDGSIYSYLPAYRRSRRVVGDQRGDAFMGTDFSMEDLSRLGFAEEFTAEVVSSTATQTELLLTALDSSAHRYPKLRIQADNQTFLPTLIEHLDEAGIAHRRLILDDVRPVNGHPFAFRIQLEDLDRKRHCTAIVQQIQVDQGLDDRHFQVSELNR